MTARPRLFEYVSSMFHCKFSHLPLATMPRPQAPPGFITIGSGIYISLAPLDTVSMQLDDLESAPKYVR